MRAWQFFKKCKNSVLLRLCFVQRTDIKKVPKVSWDWNSAWKWDRESQQDLANMYGHCRWTIICTICLTFKRLNHLCGGSKEVCWFQIVCHPKHSPIQLVPDEHNTSSCSREVIFFLISFNIKYIIPVNLFQRLIALRRSPPEWVLKLFSLTQKQAVCGTWM